MKRYFLLFEHKFSKEIEDSLLTFLEENGQGVEDLKNRTTPIRPLGVQSTDNIDEITRIVQAVYMFEAIPVIVLVDVLEDVVFVYKAEGTLEIIKTKVLPIMLSALKLVLSDDFTFCEVRDIRDAMKLGIYLRPSVN